MMTVIGDYRNHVDYLLAYRIGVRESRLGVVLNPFKRNTLLKKGWEDGRASVVSPSLIPTTEGTDNEHGQ